MSRILLVFTSTTHALTLTSECFSTMSLSCVKSSSRYWKIMTKAFITKWMCVKIISLAIGVHVNPSCRQSYLKSVPSEFFFTLQYLWMPYSYWTKIALKDLLWLALCYHIMHYVLISFELIFVKLLSAMGEQHVWGFLLRDLTWTSTQLDLWVYNVVKMGFPFAGIIPVCNYFAV